MPGPFPKDNGNIFPPAAQEGNDDPFSAIEAEEALIGSVLLDPEALPDVLDVYPDLMPRCFKPLAHQAIWTAILNAYDSGLPVNDVTVTTWLREHGRLDEALSHVGSVGIYINYVPSPGYACTYARQVMHAYTGRRANLLAQQMMMARAKGDMDAYARLLAELTDLDEPPGEEGKFTFQPASAVMQLPPMTWLIHQVLPSKGTGAIWSPPGEGKTNVLLDMCASIVTGQPWHQKVTRRGPVAYISAEGNEGLSLRLRAIRAARGLAPDALDHLYILGDAPQLMDPGDVRALKEAIKVLPEPPVLIVIDTLARCAVGAEENNQKDMGLFVAAMDTLKQEFGCFVIVAHHANAPGERLRGSTVLLGAFETVLHVQQTGKSGTITVDCDKQKDGAAPFDRIVLQIQQMRLDGLVDVTSCVLIDGDATQVDRAATQIKQRLLELLYKQGAQGNTTQWERAAKTFQGLSRSAFYRWVQTLQQEELIMKGPGKRDPYVFTLAGLRFIGKEALTPALLERPKRPETSSEHLGHSDPTEGKNVPNVQRAISSGRWDVSPEGEDVPPEELVPEVMHSPKLKAGKIPPEMHNHALPASNVHVAPKPA